MIRRRSVLLAATLAVAAGGARAQTYPSRPIRIIVPWPPGQATDLACRVLAQKLSEQLGQPVVAENRAGAGGMIGTDAAAKAAPDGYTILAASSGPVTTNPLIQHTAYDVDRDLAPVALLGVSPYLLVARPSFPAANVREFIATVRAAPDRYTFSSSGIGATAHLISEWFNTSADLQAVHVPFPGSAPALNAVVAGQVDYTIETLAGTNPLARSGQVKAFGISLARGSALAPDIPPIAADIPGFDVGAWLGIMAPAGTPRPIVERLAAEIDRAMASAETRERFASIGVEVDSRPAEAFAAYLKEQRAIFARIVERANIKLD